MVGAREFALLAFVLLIGCGGDDVVVVPPEAATPLDRATTGTITGTVGFQGTPPAMRPLNFGSDAGCAAQHPEPVLSGDALVKDGRVENAFVYVNGGLETRTFATPTAPVTIDQQGCLYAPRVAGAQVGQPVVFLNSDPLLHNVHGVAKTARSFNFGLGVKGASRTMRFAKPEVMIDLRCDVHPWMRGYLGVVVHPYFAVTRADGRFTLADVPPGDYTLASWHERFGTREARVTLGPRETKDVVFAYADAPGR